MEKLIPNSTQTPNVILDFVISRIPEAEGKCILYICRRTFGFQREEDRISLSQFVDGIIDRNGKRLDYGTGLSRPSVVEALKNLVKSEVIIPRESTLGRTYKLNLEMDPDEVVKKINQLRNLTKIGKKSKPKQVKLFNPQYKGNKGNKELPCGAGDKPGDKNAKAEEHKRFSAMIDYEIKKTFKNVSKSDWPEISFFIKMKNIYGENLVMRVMGLLRESLERDWRPKNHDYAAYFRGMLKSLSEEKQPLAQSIKNLAQGMSMKKYRDPQEELVQ